MYKALDEGCVESTRLLLNRSLTRTHTHTHTFERIRIRGWIGY